jgi:hypothetical protein
MRLPRALSHATPSTRFLEPARCERTGSDHRINPEDRSSKPPLTQAGPNGPAHTSGAALTLRRLASAPRLDRTHAEKHMIGQMSRVVAGHRSSTG